MSELKLVKASDIEIVAPDTTGKCNDYPRCSHKGYPDCLDLHSLINRLDWPLTSAGLSSKGSYVSIDEVILAAEWINHNNKTCFQRTPLCQEWLKSKPSKVRYKWVGSYELKHIVERAVGRYISNGAMIAAAILMDVDYKDRQGPNLKLRVRMEVA